MTFKALACFTFISGVIWQFWATHSPSWLYYRYFYSHNFLEHIGKIVTLEKERFIMNNK